MDAVLGVIKRIGLFLIFAQTLSHFIPTKSYEPYMKLLIGSMSIALTITPILSAVFQITESELLLSLERCQKEMEDIWEEKAKEVAYKELNLEEIWEQAIGDKINDVLVEEGYEVQAIQKQGECYLVDLKHSTTAVGERIGVEVIAIGESKKTKEKNALLEQEEKRMKEVIKEKLGIHEENIEVTVYE